MDGREPISGAQTPHQFSRLMVAAAIFAVAASSSLARGEAMGVVAIDAAPPAVVEKAETTGAASAKAANGATNLATAGTSSSANDKTATREPESAPLAEKQAEPAVAKGSAPAAPRSPSAPSLQNPAGLSMTPPHFPPQAPASEPQVQTFASPTPPAVSAATPQNFAPANPPATAPAVPPPVVNPPETPATKIDHAIERKAIQPRTPAAQAPASQPASVPSASSGWAKSLGNLGQVGAALAIVIGLILVGKALARKFIPGARAASGKGVVEVLARHPLAKNQSIVLVRIGSQIVALNQGKESSQSVLVISDQTEVARIIGQIEGQSPKSIQSGFNNLLANARMDLERGEDPDQEPDLRTISPENLDEQLEEMAAAKRQLMELRQHVRSVRDSMPRA